jgi:phenylacetate-CoA ligase
VCSAGKADLGIDPPVPCTRRELARELFANSRLPPLVPYDPGSRFFEEIEGTLLFSGDNGIPLIR